MKNIITFTSVNKRENNEDSCLAFELLVDIGGQEKKVSILLLSDGMGGHEHGELTSNLVVDSMSQLLSKRLFNLSITSGIKRESTVIDKVDLEKIIYECMVQTNQKVLALIKNNKWKKAGATVVVGIVIDDFYYWGSLGDSDLFHWKHSDNKLEKISYDHSVVGILLEEGAITPEVAGFHAEKHKIVYYMGIEKIPQMDKVKCVGKGQLERNDVLFLCSDGISGKPKQEDLQEIFNKHLGKTDIIGKSKGIPKQDRFDGLIEELVELNRRLDETDNQTLVMFLQEEGKESEFPEKDKILLEIEEKNRALKSAEEEKDKILSELHKKSEGLRLAETEKKRTTTELNEKLKDIETAEDEKSQLQKELERKAQAIEKSKEEIIKLQKELEEKREALQETEKERNKIKNDLADRLEDTRITEEEKERLRIELDGKKDAVKSLEEEIIRIKKELDKKKGKIQRTEDEKKKIADKLEAQIRALKSAEEKIFKTKSELDEKLKALESSNKEKKNISIKLEEEKERSQSMIEEKNKKMGELRTENKNLLKANRRWKFTNLALILIVALIFVGFPGIISNTKGTTPKADGRTAQEAGEEPQKKAADKKIEKAEVEPTETQNAAGKQPTGEPTPQVPTTADKEEQEPEAAEAKNVASQDEGDEMIHTVKKGDTIGKIARMYNVPDKEIIKLNKLKDPNSISIGDIIKIPKSQSKKTNNDSKRGK